MPPLSLSERARIAILAAERSRRTAVSRALHSPVLRWRYGAPVADQLLIVPQDLRTADASFWREVRLGQFGLAGSVAVIGSGSPFDLRSPSPAWERALHGFDWLRHLSAAGNDDARSAARQLATEWAIRHRNGAGVAWEPAVLGRRVISWLSHATFLLEGADTATFDRLSSSLGLQLIRLAAAWREAPDGPPRLVALVALVLADLCIAGRDRRLAADMRMLTDELSRQILSDGGHISRNPALLVDLMLDFLPLRQCFAARGRQPPEALLAVMRQMLAMLRYMRLGDGMLARFNGAGVPSPASLATVLAYDDSATGLVLDRATASRYQRLEAGDTVIIADVGPPPPLIWAGEAHAGCLSFEMSTGTRLLFVNGGAPGPADGDWRPASRSTASHNTLVLGEKSSSKLVNDSRLEGLMGSAPIRWPDGVSSKLQPTENGLALQAQHDGYVRRFGMLHTRRLVLESSGRRLSGTDTIEPPRGKLRLKRDIPFAISFHLHPDAGCKRLEGVHAAEIDLGADGLWRFEAGGASLSIEESIYYCDSAGPLRSLQIVARGATAGETIVRWSAERAV